MKFTDFVTFDAAAQSVFDDPICQHRFRACLARLAETAERFPGRFLAEAAKKESRKGVAFKQKSLDDLETSVFAQRLANRLPTKPAGGNYGEFLHQGILRQGEVLGDRALNTLDRLSARHVAALPQVRHAVDRIHRHLEPLMTEVK